MPEREPELQSATSMPEDTNNYYAPLGIRILLHNNLNIIFNLQKISDQTMVELSNFKCQVQNRRHDQYNRNNVKKNHQMSALTLNITLLIHVLSLYNVVLVPSQFVKSKSSPMCIENNIIIHWLHSSCAYRINATISRESMYTYP